MQLAFLARYSMPKILLLLTIYFLTHLNDATFLHNPIDVDFKNDFEAVDPLIQAYQASHLK